MSVMIRRVLFKSRQLSQQEAEAIQICFREGRYDEAFQLCQKTYKKQKGFPPANILYMGACALFGLGHIHQAEQWVQEYGKATKHQTAYLYLSAYLCLHRGQSERALLQWTSILQLDPSQTFADHLIERLKHREDQVLREVEEPRNFSRYISLDFVEDTEREDPSGAVKGRDPFWKLAVSGVVLGMVTILAGVILFFPDLQPSAFISFFHRDILELPPSPSSGTLLLPGQYGKEKPLFIYNSRAELIEAYKTARKQILQGKVNQARSLLGRLELSNASFEIKERVLLLRAAIPFIKLNQFHDLIGLSKVQSEPYLYRGAQVFWKAQLKAIKPNAQGIALELERADGQEGSRILLHYQASSKQKKEILAQLNTKNEIRFFGTFKGIEGGRLKIKAHRILPAD